MDSRFMVGILLDHAIEDTWLEMIHPLVLSIVAQIGRSTICIHVQLVETIPVLNTETISVIFQEMPTYLMMFTSFHLDLHWQMFIQRIRSHYILCLLHIYTHMYSTYIYIYVYIDRFTHIIYIYMCVTWYEAFHEWRHHPPGVARKGTVGVCLPLSEKFDPLELSSTEPWRDPVMGRSWYTLYSVMHIDNIIH